eukprot:CAMPEP_0183714938 /NCGR_PEP_ID=MMETSP0737-20130205/9344_1 /TAXON_ID=385413 /ORGANISM="Thalassiosira miniscula, Strain CCMP1093" /LENGTH=281 /DNA_ID=CAMNT_0025943977 /DNA_START=189 /DNA_END=1034 /DNA_ORIENTATION=+
MGTSTHSKRRKGCTSSNNHIRFDEESSDAATDMPTPPKDAHSQSTTGASTSNPDNPRKNKRKRKRPSNSNDVFKTERNSDSSSCAKLFNGLIVAISTLESKQQSTSDGDDPYHNYKTLKEALQTLGATISPQVHKRVHYLISTDAAVQNLTQRVRQALKRNVDIVDVSWVKECKEQKTRVDADNYLCNELAKCLMVEKEKEKKEKASDKNIESNSAEINGNNNKLNEEDECIPVDDYAGWSTPVELDCCCVCHENGDDNCPWCPDCNLTKARLAKARDGAK